MKSIPAGVFSRINLDRPTGMGLTSIVVPLVAGLILAVLVLLIGPAVAPLFIALLFLPWLIKDPFRLFIWLIITWPILTLYVRIPLPGGIPDISYDRILILLLGSTLVIEGLLHKRQLTGISLLDVLVLLYVAVQLGTRLHVMWFRGVGSVELNGFLDVILLPVLLYWAVKNLLVSKTQLQWLLVALFLAALIICATGLYEQAVGARVFKLSAALGGSETSYLWQDAQGGLRAAGALGNPAIYGAVLGMGSLAGICSLSLVKRQVVRVALLAGIAVLLYGVFASYTRSAWLSVLAVLFIAQFFVNGLWKKTLPILLAVLLILVLQWSAIPENSTVVARALNTKTIFQRVDLMNIGWGRFLEKPLLGWGSGALNLFGLLGEGNISHNVYLTLLVDGGLVLFLSFLAVAAYVLVRSVHAYRAFEKGSVAGNVLIAMTGNILIFLLLGLGLELRIFGYINALFWISAGVIDRLAASRGASSNELYEEAAT